MDLTFGQAWVNYEFPFRNLFPSTPFKLLPNFRRTNMHTESLAVIQKQWREKNSELEFVIDPSLIYVYRLSDKAAHTIIGKRAKAEKLFFLR